MFSKQRISRLSGARIGSGGATLNALQIGAQSLWSSQSQSHHAVDEPIDAEWLSRQRFLILHRCAVTSCQYFGISPRAKLSSILGQRKFTSF